MGWFAVMMALCVVTAGAFALLHRDDERDRRRRTTLSPSDPGGVDMMLMTDFGSTTDTCDTSSDSGACSDSGGGDSGGDGGGGDGGGGDS